jgi:Holliday junction resolvasome RuvABC endonuclease subunit
LRGLWDSGTGKHGMGVFDQIAGLPLQIILVQLGGFQQPSECRYQTGFASIADRIEKRLARFQFGFIQIEFAFYDNQGDNLTVNQYRSKAGAIAANVSIVDGAPTLRVQVFAGWRVL